MSSLRLQSCVGRSVVPVVEESGQVVRIQVITVITDVVCKIKKRRTKSSVDIKEQQVKANLNSICLLLSLSGADGLRFCEH